MSEHADMATDLDRQMMARAIALAKQAAELDEVPIAAVIYQGQNILAEAHNRRELDNDPTAHAEILALREAAAKLKSWRLLNCTMAVTLEPCPMCAGALVNARLPRLVYGADDPKMGCVRTLHQLCEETRFNHRLTVVPGVLADETADLLRQFFKQKR